MTAPGCTTSHCKNKHLIPVFCERINQRADGLIDRKGSVFPQEIIFHMFPDLRLKDHMRKWELRIYTLLKEAECRGFETGFVLINRNYKQCRTIHPPEGSDVVSWLVSEAGINISYQEHTRNNLWFLNLGGNILTLKSGETSSGKSISCFCFFVYSFVCFLGNISKPNCSMKTEQLSKKDADQKNF